MDTNINKIIKQVLTETKQQIVLGNKIDTIIDKLNIVKNNDDIINNKVIKELVSKFHSDLIEKMENLK